MIIEYSSKNTSVKQIYVFTFKRIHPDRFIVLSLHRIYITCVRCLDAASVLCKHGDHLGTDLYRDYLSRHLGGLLRHIYLGNLAPRDLDTYRLQYTIKRPKHDLHNGLCLFLQCCLWRLSER